MQTMSRFSRSVSFDTVSSTGDMVYKRGKIFQCGEYPDKGVTVTVESLRNGLSRFKPCDINVEHRKSPFDGKLGKLVEVTVDDDGAVYGILEMSTAAATLLGAMPCSVSIELTPDFVVEGIALTTSPRVKDAAVFAAVESPMKDLLKKLFGDKVDASDEKELARMLFASSNTPITEAQPQPKGEPAPGVTVEQFSELQTQLALERSKSAALAVTSAAAKFADSLVAENVIAVAGRDQAIEVFRALANSEGAKFSDTGELVIPAAVTALDGLLKSRPVIEIADPKALPGERTTQMSADEIAAEKATLLGATQLGRTAVKGGN